MDRDIITPSEKYSNDSNFFETWKERKARHAAAKAEKLAKGERPVGYFLVEPGKSQVLKSYARTQSMTATAKELKCSRHIVRRVLYRNNVQIFDRVPRKNGLYTDFYEFTVYVPGPLYRSVKTAAKLNNRKITKEVLAALAKLYG